MGRLSLRQPNGVAGADRTRTHAADPRVGPGAKGLQRRLREDGGDVGSDDQAVVSKSIRGRKLAKYAGGSASSGFPAQGPAMSDAVTRLFADFDRGAISRRQLLQTLGMAAVGAPIASALGQGRCRDTHNETPACDTTAIKPDFDPTGWKTVLLDHLSMQVVDHEKEAAFFNALMGWKVRSVDATSAVLDIGDFGAIVIKGGAPAGSRPSVDSFCFGIEPWDAKKVEAELKKRGLTPVADNDGKGFESFHF